MSGAFSIKAWRGLVWKEIWAKQLSSNNKIRRVPLFSEIELTE